MQYRHELAKAAKRTCSNQGCHMQAQPDILLPQANRADVPRSSTRFDIHQRQRHACSNIQMTPLRHPCRPSLAGTEALILTRIEIRGQAFKRGLLAGDLLLEAAPSSAGERALLDEIILGRSILWQPCHWLFAMADVPQHYQQS